MRRYEVKSNENYRCNISKKTYATTVVVAIPLKVISTPIRHLRYSPEFLHLRYSPASIFTSIPSPSIFTSIPSPSILFRLLQAPVRSISPPTRSEGSSPVHAHPSSPSSFPALSFTAVVLHSVVLHRRPSPSCASPPSLSQPLQSSSGMLI
ncbi:hypothetical protein RIF29_25353 [Crotalaria pallida]|uniref:Uncharacterized protein n=1 Tax=Crotalaria pallida TaxID=3830 RepID=A0AAN9ERE3_CROPI